MNLYKHCLNLSPKCRDHFILALFFFLDMCFIFNSILDGHTSMHATNNSL